MKKTFEEEILEKMRDMRNSTGCKLSDQLIAIATILKNQGK